MGSISVRKGAATAGALAVAGLAARWVRCRSDRPRLYAEADGQIGTPPTPTGHYAPEPFIGDPPQPHK